LKFEVFALCIFSPRYFSWKVENDDEDVDDDEEGFVASKLAVVDANDGTGGVDVDDVGVDDAVEGVGEY
jgi:hypothetical protein